MNACFSLAEVCGSLRNRVRKSLKTLCGSVLRKFAEVAEVASQAIENIMRKYAEVTDPYGVRAPAGARARPRVAITVPVR